MTRVQKDGLPLRHIRVMAYRAERYTDKYDLTHIGNVFSRDCNFSLIRAGVRLLKATMARVLGDVSVRDCLLLALLVVLLVAPITCAVYPDADGEELQTYQN